jgi:excisionase family DNA binding protein
MPVAEVAAILKLNQQTVRNWIDQGMLPAHHVGQRVPVRRSDFDQLLASSYTRGAEQTAAEAARVGVWDGEVPTPQAPKTR